LLIPFKALTIAAHPSLNRPVPVTYPGPLYPVCIYCTTAAETVARCHSRPLVLSPTENTTLLPWLHILHISYILYGAR
jgi:hypothetical protein